MAFDSLIVLAKNIKIDRENATRLSENDLLAVMRNNSHLVYEANDCSFLQNNKIDLNCTYNEAMSSNYIAFRNNNISSGYYNKIFFAWITAVEYISDSCTEITYEIDNWSTWFDEIMFDPCYVLREHVIDDTIGLHTLNEDLNVRRSRSCRKNYN